VVRGPYRGRRLFINAVLQAIAGTLEGQRASATWTRILEGEMALMTDGETDLARRPILQERMWSRSCTLCACVWERQGVTAGTAWIDDLAKRLEDAMRAGHRWSPDLRHVCAGHKAEAGERVIAVRVPTVPRSPALSAV
jgi:hypothetical protein